MNDRHVRLVGWFLVAAQAVLLVTIIVLPHRDDWSTPRLVDLLGWVLITGGGIVAAIAATDLGSALTPTPEPKRDTQLRTDGLYRHVRHPIYSGVVLAVVGVVVRSGSVVALAIGTFTAGFFHAKARWEESRLAVRYPEYATYRSVTPRFVPRRRTT